MNCVNICSITSIMVDSISSLMFIHLEIILPRHYTSKETPNRVFPCNGIVLTFPKSELCQYLLYYIGYGRFDIVPNVYPSSNDLNKTLHELRVIWNKNICFVHFLCAVFSFCTILIIINFITSTIILIDIHVPYLCYLYHEVDRKYDRLCLFQHVPQYSFLSNARWPRMEVGLEFREFFLFRGWQFWFVNKHPIRQL